MKMVCAVHYYRGSEFDLCGKCFVCHFLLTTAYVLVITLTLYQWLQVRSPDMENDFSCPSMFCMFSSCSIKLNTLQKSTIVRTYEYSYQFFLYKNALAWLNLK